MFRGIAWSGEVMIADWYNVWIGWGPAPNNGMASNDQGVSWTLFTIQRDFDTNGLARGNGRFVAVGCAGNEEACQGYGGDVEDAIYSMP